LGKKTALFRGEEEISRSPKQGEISGTIYGEKENGGTATLYVSKVPFDKVDSKLRERKVSLLFGKIENPLRDVNRWAKGFISVVSVLGAIGLALTKAGRRRRIMKISLEKSVFFGMALSSSEHWSLALSGLLIFSGW
jgi:hypothetical protein